MLIDQTVTCGDSRKLVKGVEPESVSLIFVDPVYQDHWQYQWAAAIGNIVLRPEGNLLAWYGGNRDHVVQALMEKSMQKVWTLHYTVPAKTTGNMGAFKLRCWTSFLFWFRKSRAGLPNKTILDTYISASRPSGRFKWQKNYGVLAYYLCSFTKEGDLVLDPFAGEGSVGVVCKTYRRNYIGFEIDPKRAETAQERINTTQVMSILVEPTQPELSFGKGQYVQQDGQE